MNINNIFVSFQHIILSELRSNFFYFYLYIKKKNPKKIVKNISHRHKYPFLPLMMNFYAIIF